MFYVLFFIEMKYIINRLHIFFTIILIYLHSLLWTVRFTVALYICYGLVTMNRITISLIFFITISMVLPTSAFMFVSGQSTDNSATHHLVGLLLQIIMLATLDHLAVVVARQSFYYY